jgi:signal transduction histidine kinase
MGAETVADFLRRHRARLAWQWEEAAPSLYVHGEALIGALAEWIDGDTDRVEQEFGVLASCAALQRLGYAGGLEALINEIAALRAVIVRELAVTGSFDAVIAVNAAIDRAIAVATRRYAEAREANRDRFTGMLSHDLRDPLKAVVLTARLLGRHPQVREPASRIEAACSRMMRLVGDVLDFARGHLGEGIPAHREPRDLGDIVQVVADELRAMARGRALSVTLHGDLHAEVDRDRFGQALANLVSNAIHHGRGPIDIVVRETDDRLAIVTEVTNHGGPIPAHVIDRMFDPFAHLDPIGPRSDLGLGLYIVAEVARAHDATCTVRSDEEGTTFAIRWPRASALEHAA